MNIPKTGSDFVVFTGVLKDDGCGSGFLYGVLKELKEPVFVALALREADCLATIGSI